MAEIFIEGLGNVQIQGESPNEKEENAIINALKEKETSEIQTPEIQTPEIQTPEIQTQSFIQNTANAFGKRDTALASGGLAGFATGARYGGQAGAMVGGIPGAIVGGLAGGVLGAAGTGQAYDILNSYIQGENLNLDSTSKQALKDIKRESMFSLAAASIPGLKPMVTRLLSKRGKGELVSKEAEELYKVGKRIGVNIYPLDISGSIGQGYSKVVGVFPIAGSPLKRAAERRGLQIESVKNQVLNELAPNSAMSELGVDIFQAAKNSNKEFRNVASSLYNVFYKESAKINKPFIPSEKIKIEASSIIKDFLKGRPKEVITKTVMRNGKKTIIRMKKPISPALSEKYGGFVRSLSRLEDYITPNQIKQLKKDLANFSSQASKQGGEGVLRLTKLSGAADSALRNFDKYNLSAFGKNPTIGKENLSKLVNELSKADQFYANGIKVFQRSAGQRFTKADKNIFLKGFEKPGSVEPDELFKYVVKSGSPSSLKDLRILIGDKNFARVSRKVIDNAFTKASVVGDNGLSFNPNIVEEQLGLIGRKQSDVLKNITQGTNLNPQRLKDLLLVSKAHANMPLPDVSSFIQRRAMLGGVKSIAGGVVMGAGAVTSPTATIPLVYLTKKASKFFASPKNVGLAIEALDITAPRSIRYIAGDKLLRGLIKDSEGAEKETYREFQEYYKKNKFDILDQLTELN